MTTDDKITDEKDISREAAKISLASSKVDKCEYLADEKILPSDQRRAIEQANFTYFPLGKVLGNKQNSIEDQGKKEIKAF